VDLFVHGVGHAAGERDVLVDECTEQRSALPMRYGVKLPDEPVER
jgi:hypothetical protein